MTQGELEKIPLVLQKQFSDLEIRIMEDLVRRIKINGFSTASADWQITRLQQLGKSEEDIKEWIRIALDTSDEEIERVFSDEVYEQYMGHERAYQVNGMRQIPFEENQELQSLIEGVKQQTHDTFRNMTASLGFVKQDVQGHIQGISLTDFYRTTLDQAMLDIHSGAFDYQTVLQRTIEDMTKSGIRLIDYKGGRHNRVDVAARRAVMTGFRQIQGKINEQVASDLGTDSYEVTYHVGARPSHQVWQGRVWTMQQLKEVCGLGSVTGLHGANCYHDYNAFIPGVSVRTYTDEQLKQMTDQENEKRIYNGREYTTYEALQQQRKMERSMRKTREDIHLMEEGEADSQGIILKKAKYQGQMQAYKDFSKKMKLPEQIDRVYQDGLSMKTPSGGKPASGTSQTKQSTRQQEAPGMLVKHSLNSNNKKKHTVRKGTFENQSVNKTSIDDSGLKEYTQQEIQVFSSKTEELVNKYVKKKSRWSGNIIVGDEKRYGKLWNCDIITSSETSPHIILHEQLHARSISYYDIDTYIDYQNIEEAVVQFVAQEISRAEGIKIIESQYDGMVDALREINKKIKICGNDIDFAVKLLEMDVTERLDWLDNKIYECLMSSGTIEDYEILAKLMEGLR